MSNLTPTCGSWYAKQGHDQMVSQDTTITHAVGRTDGKGPYWFIFSTAETHGDPEADARLIAAAPELLEALKDLLGDVEGLADEFSICREISESSYSKAARAAIAKAEGRQS